MSRPMAETTVGILIHYLEAIVRKAELPGFDEMRAEIESVAAADVQAAAARLKEAEVDADVALAALKEAQADADVAKRLLKRVLDTLRLTGAFTEDQLIRKVQAINDAREVLRAFASLRFESNEAVLIPLQQRAMDAIARAEGYR